MKKLIYNLLSTYHYKKSVNRLRKLENQLVTPLSRLAIPFVFRGKGHFKTIKCMQNQTELADLYEIIRKLNPQNMVEIGTAKGGSLYLWLQAAKAHASIVSIDLPEGEFGGGYCSHRIPFYKSFAKPTQNLHLIRANSHSQDTFSKVKDIFNGESIDFLFIDGDHTYEGVKHDFELYSKLVRPGGVIALHDILPRADIPSIQVHRFWEEIRDKYQFLELIGPESGERRIGNGVVFC